MNGVILFQSKYGTTKRYAEWLSAATGFTVLDVKKAKLKDVIDFDVVILGGGVYASGIAGLSFFKKHFNNLKNKSLLIFCVGASPFHEDVLRTLASHNLKNELSDIPLFYCQGAWDLERMSWIDRTMCKLILKVIAKKDPATLNISEKALLKAGDTRYDWTDKKYLEPIIEYLNR